MCSSENQARVQITVLGQFVTSYRDIDTLRGFWRGIGVLVNRQSLFTDFNWNKELLAVSICFVSRITRYHPKSTFVDSRSFRLHQILFGLDSYVSGVFPSHV